MPALITLTSQNLTFSRHRKRKSSENQGITHLRVTLYLQQPAEQRSPQIKAYVNLRYNLLFMKACYEQKANY